MQRLLLATTALAAISLPAFAQSEEAEVIIVTAQKREQAITEVPIAITAYGQEQLDELGVQQFDDLADFVPGLEVQEQSANNPGFVIRGITSDSGDATIEPRVSIYQDGVSIARSRGSFVEVFDTGAEVIRGPQPTLFGRSALIGAINLTSNRVDLDERAGSFRVGGGNLDFRFAEGMVNLPLNDMIGVRLAGRWKTRDGYIESLSAEDDFNGFETLALRASIRIQPTDALDAYIIINHHADNNPGTSFKSGTFLPSPTGSIDPWEPANLNSFGPFEGGKELGLERHVNSYTVLVDYDLNDVFTLSSVTNYREFDSSEIFDPDGFGYDLFVFAENAQGDQFSQEFRLGFEELNGFSGFVGASYFEEDGFQNVPLGYDERIAQALLGGFLFTDAPGTPQNPLPLAFIPNVNANPSSPLFGAPLGYFEESFTNFGKAQAWEFFADTTWQATDRLALTAGLRHTQDQKTSAYAADSRGLSNLTGVGIFLGTGVVTNGERVSRSDEFDGTTWRLAADFDLTDDVKLFANYASGRRPEVISYALSTGDTSVFATGQLNPANFNVLPAEEVDAYELGLKGDFLGGLVYGDASVYTYQYENFQTSIVNDIGQIEPINAGNATAFGFETTLTGRLNEWTELFGVYAYTDATFDDEDSSGNRQVFAGNTFRLQPEHAFSLGARFEHENDLGLFSFAPVYSYKSEVFFDNDNDTTDAVQDEFQDGFGLLDLRLNWTDRDDRFGLEFFVENALDEEYIIDAGNTGDAFGIATFIAGAPRTYGVYLSGKF